MLRRRATYTINKAMPTVTWPTPAAISYGTALSATQLNATASTPGTFAYTPAAGTVLMAGVQPRVELLRESASQKSRHHKLEQVVTEGGLFFGCAPLGRHEVGSSEKRVHENTSVAHRSEKQNNGVPCGGKNRKTHPLPGGSPSRTGLKQLRLEWTAMLRRAGVARCPCARATSFSALRWRPWRSR